MTTTRSVRHLPLHRLDANAPIIQHTPALPVVKQFGPSTLVKLSKLAPSAAPFHVTSVTTVRCSNLREGQRLWLPPVPQHAPWPGAGAPALLLPPRLQSTLAAAAPLTRPLTAPGMMEKARSEADQRQHKLGVQCADVAARTRSPEGCASSGASSCCKASAACTSSSSSEAAAAR